MNNRMAFIDFCQGLLNMNPIERWSPQQARLHPFITGEKWTKPWTVSGLTCGYRPCTEICDSQLVLGRPNLPRPQVSHLPEVREVPPSTPNDHTEVLFLLNPRVRVPIRMPPHTTSTWPSIRRTLRRRKQPLKRRKTCTGTPTCSPRPRSRNQRRTVPVHKMPQGPTSQRHSSSLLRYPRLRRIAP